MSEKQKGDNGKKIIIIVLILLLLVSNGVQYYFSNAQEKVREAKIVEQEGIINIKNEEAAVQFAKLTSLEEELDIVREEKIALGLSVEELDEQIEALKASKAHLTRNYMSPAVRKEMQTKIANYELMLNQQNETIRQLKARNDSLFNQTIVLKDTINTLGDTISTLAGVNVGLSEEVRKGSILRVSNFHISAIKKPDKNRVIHDYEHIYKNKELVHTQFDFEIQSNPIAKIGEKEMYLQIIGPDGAVVFDQNTGGGAFTVDGKKMNYTIKQNIMYTREDYEVSLIFVKTIDFEEGEHKVKVWCENEVIGLSSFIVD